MDGFHGFFHGFVHGFFHGFFPRIPYMVSDVFWMDFSMIFPYVFFCCINGFWFSSEDFKKLAGLSYEI